MSCCVLLYCSSPVLRSAIPCTGHSGSASSSAWEDSDTPLPTLSWFHLSCWNAQKWVPDLERASKPLALSLSLQKLGYFLRDEGDRAWDSALRSHGETHEQRSKCIRAIRTHGEPSSSSLTSEIHYWHQEIQPALLPEGPQHAKAMFREFLQRGPTRIDMQHDPVQQRCQLFAAIHSSLVKARLNWTGVWHFIFPPNSSGWELLSRPGFR